MRPIRVSLLLRSSILFILSQRMQAARSQRLMACGTSAIAFARFHPARTG